MNTFWKNEHVKEGVLGPVVKKYLSSQNINFTFMGFFDKIFGGKNEFNFGGVLYPLTADKNIFIQTISSTKYGALTIKTKRLSFNN